MLLATMVSSYDKTLSCDLCLIPEVPPYCFLLGPPLTRSSTRRMMMYLLGCGLFLKLHARHSVFSASVNSILKSEDEYVHARRFVHVSGRDERTRSPFTEDDGDPGPGPLEWVGAFKLSLKVLPLGPVQGWYMGTNLGRKSEEIDLLLAPSSKTWASKRIASMHASTSMTSHVG
jgi:hypothetical protein